MSNQGCWLAVHDLEALAAELPPAERHQLWQWALEHPGKRGDAAAWQQGQRRSIEEQATALRELFRQGAEDTPEREQRFRAGVQWLREQEQQYGASTGLADQLCQMVGALHDWLVNQNGGGARRAHWFWQGWELLEWRQGMETPLPDWWPVVKEQLVRYGALAWRDEAEGLDAATSQGQEAISRTLTLLAELTTLHQPTPEWIQQMQRDLVAAALARLVGSSSPTEAELDLALQWTSAVAGSTTTQASTNTSASKLALLGQQIDQAGLQTTASPTLQFAIHQQESIEQADALLRRGEWQQARAILDELEAKKISQDNKQQTIRTIHHLACTGGTVISKCLAAMPGVALVSEVNPLNRFGNDFEPTNPLLLLERSYRELTVEEVKEDFLGRMAQAVKICHHDGMKLVIRDHSHTDFCMGDHPRGLTPICDFLGEHYSLISVITVRHPLDSYLGLLAQNWQSQFSPSTLEEYCQRYLAFLERYRELPLRRYEDFCIAPEPFMEELCALLELEYSPSFMKHFGDIKLSGDSGRGSTTEIRPRTRRPIPEELQAELQASASYRILLDRLRYIDDNQSGTDVRTTE